VSASFASSGLDKLSAVVIWPVSNKAFKFLAVFFTFNNLGLSA